MAKTKMAAMAPPFGKKAMPAKGMPMAPPKAKGNPFAGSKKKK